LITIPHRVNLLAETLTSRRANFQERDKS
jgi:hypothetical protein